MSFQRLHEYINHRLKDSPVYQNELAAEYGTENFAYFLYALVKMAKPQVMLELGTGAGITSFMAAQAMKENGFGIVYTVDDASQWSDVAMFVRDYFGVADLDYPTFIDLATRKFDLAEHVRAVSTHLATDTLYMPPGIDKLDMVYVDCLTTTVRDIGATMAFYLPRLKLYSSMFWDNASTHNHAFLFVEYVVKEFQAGRIPVFLQRLSQQDVAALWTMVRTCKFTLVHLTDDYRGKFNKLQNSRAWLKIEPNDFVPHGAAEGGVASF